MIQIRRVTEYLYIVRLKVDWGWMDASGLCCLADAQKIAETLRVKYG